MYVANYYLPPRYLGLTIYSYQAQHPQFKEKKLPRHERNSIILETNFSLPLFSKKKKLFFPSAISIKFYLAMSNLVVILVDIYKLVTYLNKVVNAFFNC